MSRYIDADDLLNTLFEIHCKECDKRKGEKNGKYKTIYEVGEAPCKSCGVNDMREYIEDAPTADVVSKEKYDELNERYHRLLESATILSDAVREYERREEENVQ